MTQIFVELKYLAFEDLPFLSYIEGIWPIDVWTAPLGKPTEFLVLWMNSSCLTAYMLSTESIHSKSAAWLGHSSRSKEKSIGLNETYLKPFNFLLEAFNELLHISTIQAFFLLLFWCSGSQNH